MLLVVVKTDAYGHGIVPIAHEAVKAGADRLGVTTVMEGVRLRENGIQIPVHLLSPITEEQAEVVVHHNLIASVSSGSVAKAISNAALKLQKHAVVHLKINTGLHRFGIEPEQALAFCIACYHLESIVWEGIYTHFSNADKGDWDTTDRQFQRFMEVVDSLKEVGYTFPIHHVGASSIALEKQIMHLEMVRPGIALFGYPPADRQMNLLPLIPVMTLKTKLINIRIVPAYVSIGYGASYVTNSIEKIGIIPIGLGDGYKMALSNKGEVLIKGKRAKIIGSISLDQTFINVTDIPDVELDDEVILIGSQDNEQISAKDIAGWIDSNVDEVLASLMSRIHRVYTSNHNN